MSKKLLTPDDHADISDRTNQKNTTPLSCTICNDEWFEESSFQEHTLSDKHQRNLIRSAQQLNDKNSSRINTNNEPPELIHAAQKLSTISQTQQNNYETLTNLDRELLTLRNDYTVLSKQIQNTDDKLSTEKAQLDVIQTNRNVLQQDALSLRQQFENHNQTIRQYPNGVLVWKISNLQEKMYDAQSERQTSIYSPACLTSSSGYLVCARLYLNGDGSARGTHMSIFLVVLRGPYDSILKWPFSFRVSFCLFDQRTMIESNGTIQPKHIIESFRPDMNSQSFSQPCSGMNIASGIPRFCPLDLFEEMNDRNLYVVNDTMYIKMFVDFIGIPRTMLPFIFNINVALPGHIQQKLISEEIERRREQNINDE